MSKPYLINDRNKIGFIVDVNVKYFIGIIKYSSDRKWREITDIPNNTRRSEHCPHLDTLKQIDDKEDVYIEYSNNNKTQCVYNVDTDELISKYTLTE